MTRAPSRWRTQARAVIAGVIGKLPDTAGADECRKVVSKAYPFGPRRHWPYRVWREEVRLFLGMPPLAPHRRRRSGGGGQHRVSALTVMPCMREWARERGLIS